MQSISSGVNSALVGFFEIEGVALALAAAILLAALIAILLVGAYRYQPLRRELAKREAALKFVGDAPTEEAAQAEFAARFDNISRVMTETDRKNGELRHAWTQFSETIVNPTDATLRATTRPDGYFLHIGEDIRILNWLSNIFVAIGLVFTFLGIVAALSKATATMGDAANMSAMQAALTDLMRIAAAKFWTSIAGVFSSILLRAADRVWRQRTRRQLEEICALLERGTLFSPAQRLAAEQLTEMREQTVQLKNFNTELAISIGEQFSQRMEPMVTVLGSIQSSIDNFAQGGFDQIGKGLQEALSANAGREMEALSGALTQMTHGLASVHERLAGSGDAANRQIEDAARQFAVASSQMTEAFATMNSRIETMADRLAKQADEAATQTAQRMSEAQAGYVAAAEENGRVLRSIGEDMRRASEETTGAMVSAVRDAVSAAMAESTASTRAALDQFTSATSGIQDAFGAMDARIRSMGETLSEGAAEAARRNAEVLDKAAQALEQAAARGAAEMTSTVTDAVARASEASATAMSETLARFGERFEAASAGLVSTLQTTAGRLEAIAAAIERSTRAADNHATQVAAAAESAQGAAVTLGRAANDVQAAAAPIRDATATINNSIVNTRELLARQAEAAQTHQQALEVISNRLEETSSAATRAWNDYRSRFEDVDKALAAALEQIKDASAEHATHLNGHVGKIDTALAEAVDRLSVALDPLQDLASSVEDMLGRLKTPA